MSLDIGTRIGPYEVTAAIGAGGMGEVYRGRDTRLKRDVALKVLPEVFSRDQERMARLQREAEVLASLSHPNIAGIYGLEGGALVMEFVDGATLSGALPLDTALNYARQIAEGLEAAHEKGIIHRDLKPANVRVTPDGDVKILDFGLARAAADSVIDANLSNSPTLTNAPTAAGVILGTAAYMSPEQAHGKLADRRADIWSFGAVLFEMLTGKQAFAGESVSDTLASVLKLEPDWSALPPTTPAPVRALLKRCLIKDRKQRLQAIGEARIAIDEWIAGHDDSTQVAAAPQRRRPFLPWLIAAAFALATVTLGWLAFRDIPGASTLRYTIVAPELVHSFAISPDGKYLVVAAGSNTRTKRQLWLRRLDALEFTPMPSTEDALYPFWSPDSRNIAFFAQGKLKRLNLSGGPSQVICDAFDARGGDWSRNDEIVFSAGVPLQPTLKRVAASGGNPISALKDNQTLTRFPRFLPDGERFLYLLSRPGNDGGVYLASLDGGESKRVLSDYTSVVFAPSAPGADTGHLLFLRQDTLIAQQFDVRAGEVVGEAFPVASGVSFLNLTGNSPVSVSGDGTLVYSRGSLGTIASNQLVWYDRSGKPDAPRLIGGAARQDPILTPALSPDQRSLAFSRPGGTTNSGIIWLRDLNRGTDLRLTSNSGGNYSPAWSPNSDRFAFMANTPNDFKIFQKAVNPAAIEELLVSGTRAPLRPSQYSPDGKYLVYTGQEPKTNLDVLILSLESTPGERKPEPLLSSESNELHGQISPNQKWIAYTSDASGGQEVYLQPFPSVDRVTRVSLEGGMMPRWRGDSKELFFVDLDGTMMAAPVSDNPAAVSPVGAPVPLFESNIILGPTVNIVYQYDVTADGKRFAVVTTGTNDTSSASTMTVVVNWNSKPDASR
jgi:Tol biopolymer transport system component